MTLPRSVMAAVLDWRFFKPPAEPPRPARQTVVRADPDVVQPPGLSYVCRVCQVYGYLPAGDRRRCWCCGDNALVRR